MSNTMAITRPIRSLLVGRGFAAALALGGAGCSVYPSSPAEPAFDTDVLPIFQAHCTHCHDNNPDGGGHHAVYRPDANGGPITAGAPALTRVRPLLPFRRRCSSLLRRGRIWHGQIHDGHSPRRHDVCGCRSRRRGRSTTGR